MLDGKLISEPHYDRAAVGLINQPESTQIVMGHLKFVGEISLGPISRLRRGQPARVEVGHAVNGLNRPLAKDELIIFTPEFHKTTLTTPDVAEAVVSNGTVRMVRDHRGSSEIPSDGLWFRR
jgi:hypothetical protein